MTSLLRFVSLIFSFFSILFSLRIIFELKDKGAIDETIFTTLIAFATVFVCFNEFVKVDSLEKKFYFKTKFKAVTYLTFGISFGLSTSGIITWIDKTQDQKVAQSESVQTERISINEKYYAIVDSIHSLNNETVEYQQNARDIHYWRTRNCKTVELREQARTEIAKLESHKRNLEAAFKKTQQHKIERIKQMQNDEIKLLEVENANFNDQLHRYSIINMIMFAMVALTEIAIGYIQYLLSKTYTDEQKVRIKVLTSILMQNTENITTITLKHNKDFNPSLGDNENFKKEEIKFRYLLGNLGIISKIKEDNGKILNQKHGVKVLKKYYRKDNGVIT